jgi:hypothetical protein
MGRTSSARAVRGSRFAWHPDRADSPSANLSLLRSWRTTDQAGIRSRVPKAVPPTSGGGRPTVAPRPSQSILANQVIQKIFATRAGEPKHEADVPARHRVERYPGEARPGAEQQRHQLARAYRAGTQIVIPVAQIQPGLFLETEHGQRLAETRHAYGKRIRRAFRASTSNPELWKPPHSSCHLLPATPIQDERDRKSNPHY